jgi:prepilin signal peptidase PulO-like enzyme (type II secretory pathway)
MNPQLMVLFGVFLFCMGACVGSFLNVVIWRLPNRGHEVMYLGKKGPLTLSWPPSHCPVCDHPIYWYQNIPVFAWLALRGKCANCKTSIPIRYPLVELGTAMLFLGLYLAYFVADMQPGIVDIRTDWPVLILHLLFAAALFAGSAIDADLYIIPLEICWFILAIGIAGSGLIGPPLTKSYPIIPSLTDTFGAGGWLLAKPVLGAAAGLALANILMLLKIMPRSFDGPDWNKDVPINPADAAKEHSLPPPPKFSRFQISIGIAVLILATFLVLWLFVSLKAGAIAGLSAGILIFLVGVLPRDEGQVDVTDEVLEEISNPNVRREMMKEVLFLALPLAAGVVAWFIPGQLMQAPWVDRLLGSMLGLLAGGGILWFFRTAGTFAFGREAMGMGDAHLMAAVGAVLGFKLVLLAFLLSPFPAILWIIVLKLMGKPNVLPFGPWLSVASIMVLLLGNPLFDAYLVLIRH